MASFKYSNIKYLSLQILSGKTVSSVLPQLKSVFLYYTTISALRKTMKMCFTYKIKT